MAKQKETTDLQELLLNTKTKNEFTQEKQMLPVKVTKQFCYSPYLNVSIDPTGMFEWKNEESLFEAMDWLHRLCNKWYQTRLEEIQSVGIYDKNSKGIPKEFSKGIDFEQSGVVVKKTPSQAGEITSGTPLCIPKIPDEIIKSEAEDIAYTAVKKKIATFKTKEEADKYLSTTEFWAMIDAKRYINELFKSKK